MAGREPLTDAEFTRIYTETLLLKHGVEGVDPKMALIDRAAFPGLSPQAVAAERSQLHWNDLMDADEAKGAVTTVETADDAMASIVASAPAAAENAAPITAKPAENKPTPASAPARRRPAAVLPVVPTTQYHVGDQLFTDIGEAVLYAYAMEMEKATGMPMDMDVLKASAQRILDLTADYINRTRED
jgi:hypothetical protein